MNFFQPGGAVQSGAPSTSLHHFQQEAQYLARVPAIPLSKATAEHHAHFLREPASGGGGGGGGGATCLNPSWVCSWSGVVTEPHGIDDEECCHSEPSVHSLAHSTLRRCLFDLKCPSSAQLLHISQKGKSSLITTPTEAPSWIDDDQDLASPRILHGTE
eukprot:CAMPEP_0194535092 /NCGR_PEP_ID=MMETSP0253-20130528/73519_1 /TAXON_ID=2966 /ORGANISM="Noctiluca scintillans" /LENGTH=158 /DNA_ID=CAMNT_0039380827 /DNA_START=217 /DNA_END=692 /DNA_ORIENTATION=-